MASERGKRLLAARVAAELSQDDAAYAARDVLPKSIRPTGMTVSRLERGENIADQLDIVVALCLVYGVSVADTAPELAADVIKMHDMYRQAKKSLSSAQNAGYITLGDEILDIRLHTAAETDEELAGPAIPVLCLT